MKSILFIQKKQFGYHTDSYKVAQYLKKDFKITFVSFDVGLQKVSPNSINVKYVSTNGAYIKRGVRFLVACIKEARKEYDHRFMVYFSFCSFVKFFSGNEIILDFRTGSVASKKWKRILDDTLMRLETYFFDYITVISEGLRKKLKISSEKSSILPLGADVLSEADKAFDIPRLFYIGTLNNRKIDQTIRGVAIFLKENREFSTTLSYDIVGTGYNDEEEDLRKLIQESGLSQNVTIHGRKTHDEVQHLFDRCNVGVSYIPRTSYYQYQPPTKTFEYVMAGMVCIATATDENIKYINETNGILCDDTPESFASALDKCIKKFKMYDSVKIRNTLMEYSWENIAGQLKTIFSNGK